MKKLFFILFFSAIILDAQNPKNIVDSSGLKQGLWKEYRVLYTIVDDDAFFPDDTVYITNRTEYKGHCLVFEYIGEYENGVREGLWHGYYSDGIIRRIINYKNGIPNGVLKYFDIKGNILIECFIEECDSIVSVKLFCGEGNICDEIKVKKSGLLREIYME